VTRRIPPPKRGDPITADFLGAVSQHAYGAPRVTGMDGMGGALAATTRPGLKLFVAKEDFTEDPDGVMSGDAKELWYDRVAGDYTQEHGPDIKVWSFNSVSEDDRLWCVWNLQSGRWEQVAGGSSSSTTIGNPSNSCECLQSSVGEATFVVPGSPTICCTSHERWYLDLGALGTFQLYHNSDDVWSTYNSDSDLDNPYVVECYPADDEYDVVMDVAGTITLEARAALNCEAICLEYERVQTFRCKAANEFRLIRFSGPDEVAAPVCVCVQPGTCLNSVVVPDVGARTLYIGDLSGAFKHDYDTCLDEPCDCGVLNQGTIQLDLVDWGFPTSVLGPPLEPAGLCNPSCGGQYWWRSSLIDFTNDCSGPPSCPGVWSWFLIRPDPDEVPAAYEDHFVLALSFGGSAWALYTSTQPHTGELLCTTELSFQRECMGLTGTAWSGDPDPVSSPCVDTNVFGSNVVDCQGLPDILELKTVPQTPKTSGHCTACGA